MLLILVANNFGEDIFFAVQHAVNWVKAAPFFVVIYPHFFRWTKEDEKKQPL